MGDGGPQCCDGAGGLLAGIYAGDVPVTAMRDASSMQTCAYSQPIPRPLL